MKLKSICVFCGSAAGKKAAYEENAIKAGNTLAERGIRLVFGGGSVGIMGAVADGVISGKGQALGIIPHGLASRERMHEGVSEMILVGTMHERKARMASESDAFVALPGGMGTLEEFTEIFTWGQLGIHQKPFGLLNTENYFTPFIAFLDHMVKEGFLSQTHRDLVQVSDDFEELLELLENYKAPESTLWLTQNET